MHSNRASHLLFPSTFQSFRSGLFLIFPEVLDSNRLGMKIPTGKLMYTQGEEKQNPLCQVHLSSLKVAAGNAEALSETDSSLRPF